MASPQKFAWDYDVPNNAFWNSVPFTTARNFLQCFSEAEVKSISSKFDKTLSVEEKHRLLLALAKEKLSAEEHTAQTSEHRPLHEKDYDAWQKLMLALETMHHSLGQFVEEERILKAMLEHPGPGQERHWSALNMMARLLSDQGRHAEAEQSLREVKTWMESHPQIGRGSPPAMGNLRMLLTAVWKQGRYDDGRKIHEEMQQLIDDLDDTKFVQYQEEERQMLKDLMAELEQWAEKQK